MSKLRYYSICPELSKPCSNMHVEIINAQGIEISCEQKGNCLDFSVPDDADIKCIEFVVFCEDCDSCPPEYFKKCFCSDKSDCGPCESCNSLGICEKTCKEDEFCEDDICKECNENVPCTNGKICKDGKCICPPGTFNLNGVCVECDESTFFHKCYECNNGKIVPKPCAGVCDDTLGCVDCLNDNHCKGDNEVCDPLTKSCVCAPGYARNPITGKCEIAPTCKTNDECGPCKRCDGKNCVDIVCPPGYYCNGKDCVPDKCQAKPCTTKHDCDLGCGCDGGICSDCSRFTCETCGSINGCACKDGINCEDDGTRGNCKDKIELKQEGCEFVGTFQSTDSCSCPMISSGVYTTILNNYTPTFKTSDLPSDPTFNGMFTPTNASTKYTMKVKIDLRQGFASTPSKHLELKRLSDLDIENALPNNGVAKFEGVIRYRQNGVVKNLVIAPQVITFANKDLIEIASQDFGDNSFTVIDYSIKVSITGLTFPNNCKYDNLEIEREELDPNQPFETSLLKLKSRSKRYPLFTWVRSKDGLATVFHKVYVAGNGFYKYNLKGPKKINGIPLKTDEGELWAGYDYTLFVDCSCDTPKTKKLVICDIDETKFIENTHYRITNCGTKVELLDSFIPCPVNRDLKEYGETGYIIPLIAQVFYGLYINDQLVDTFIYRKLNGSWGKFRSTNTNTLGKLWENSEYVFAEKITSVKLQQLTEDQILECFKENTVETITLGDLEFNTNCTPDGLVNIVIPQNNKLGFITSLKRGSSNVSVLNGSFTIGGLQQGVDVKVTAFVGSCFKEFTITPSCCNARDIILSISENGSNFNNFTGGCTENKLYTGKIRFTNILSSLILNPGGNLQNVTWKAPNSNSFVPFTNQGTIVNGFVESNFQLDLRNSIGDVSYVFRVTDTVTNCITEKEFTFVKCNFSIDVDPPGICSGNNSTVRVSANPNTPIEISTPSGNQSVSTNTSGVFEFTTQIPGEYNIVSVAGETVNSTPKTLSVVSSPVINSITIVPNGCTNENVSVTIVGTPGAAVTITKEVGATPQVVNISGSGSVTFDIVYNTPGNKTLSVTSAVLGNCTAGSTVTANTVITADPVLTLLNMECVPDLTTYSANLTVIPAESIVTSTVGTVTKVGTSVTITGIPNNSTAIVSAVNGSCNSILNVQNNCQCVAPSTTIINQGNICEGSFNWGNTPMFNINTQGLFRVEVQYLLNNINIGTETLLNQSGNVIIPNLASPVTSSNLRLSITVDRPENPSCFSTFDINPIVFLTPVVTFSPVNAAPNNSLTVSAMVVPAVPSQPYIYTWKRTSPSGIVTNGGSTTNNLIFTPTEIGDWQFELTIGHSLGCSTTYNHTIVVFSDLCTYELFLEDSVTGSTTECSTYDTIEENGYLTVRKVYKKKVSNSCTGGITDLGFGYGKAYFISTGASFILNPTINTINVINQRVPQTLTLTGAARVSATALRDYLNSLNLGATFESIGNTVAHKVSSLNTGGFANGTYSQTTIPAQAEHISPCGLLRLIENPFLVPMSVVTSYNSVDTNLMPVSIPIGYQSAPTLIRTRTC